MEFQLDDKASFDPRFAMMVSELWDNGGKIVLHQCPNFFRDKCSILSTKILESVFEITIIVPEVFPSNIEISIHFLGVVVNEVCKSHDMTRAINDAIRKIYEKYSTDGLIYPVYQILECYLASEYSQSVFRWRNIAISIGFNVFTLAYNDEIFTNNSGGNSKDYVRRLMLDMRNNTAPEIFYAGLPIERESEVCVQ
jgi:hypothetical protein